jgi:hypothetical protein
MLAINDQIELIAPPKAINGKGVARIKTVPHAEAAVPVIDLAASVPAVRVAAEPVAALPDRSDAGPVATVAAVAVVIATPGAGRIESSTIESRTVDSSTVEAGAWLLDWSRVWTSAASSMLDATVAISGQLTTQSADRALDMLAAAKPAARAAPAEVSLWSTPPRSARPRSWYRPPTPNLLDPQTWGFPAPFAIYGVPVSAPMFAPTAWGGARAAMANPLLAPFASMMMQAMQTSVANQWAANMTPAAIWGGTGNSFGQGFGRRFNHGFNAPFFGATTFANPFAKAPEHPFSAWFSLTPTPPPTAWEQLNKAVTDAFASNTFASYRSDSGYAVAQIAISDAKLKTTSADDASAALWNLFTWPTTRLQ